MTQYMTFYEAIKDDFLISKVQIYIYLLTLCIFMIYFIDIYYFNEYNLGKKMYLLFNGCFFFKNQPNKHILYQAPGSPLKSYQRVETSLMII